METNQITQKSFQNSTKYDDRKLSILGKKNLYVGLKLTLFFIISILFYCNYALANSTLKSPPPAARGGSISLVEEWLISNSNNGDIVQIDVYDANSELEVSFSGCMEKQCSDDFSSYPDGIYFVTVTTLVGQFSSTIIK